MLELQAGYEVVERIDAILFRNEAYGMPPVAHQSILSVPCVYHDLSLLVWLVFKTRTVDSLVANGNIVCSSGGFSDVSSVNVAHELTVDIIRWVRLRAGG